MMFDGLELKIKWARSLRELRVAVEVAEQFYSDIQRVGKDRGIVVINDRLEGRALYIYKGLRHLIVELRDSP